MGPAKKHIFKSIGTLISARIRYKYISTYIISYDISIYIYQIMCILYIYIHAYIWNELKQQMETTAAHEYPSTLAAFIDCCHAGRRWLNTDAKWDAVNTWIPGFGSMAFHGLCGCGSPSNTEKREMWTIVNIHPCGFCHSVSYILSMVYWSEPKYTNNMYICIYIYVYVYIVIDIYILYTVYIYIYICTSKHNIYIYMKHRYVTTFMSNTTFMRTRLPPLPPLGLPGARHRAYQVYLIYIRIFCCWMIFWLVVKLPLWKIWTSIGMIRNPIYVKIKNVPNHQPVLIQSWPWYSTQRPGNGKLI